MEFLYTKMGTVGERRLNCSAPFEFLQSDLFGPYLISEHVNQRSMRKVWVMCNVDHFRTYISLTAVESLSEESILNAFHAHFHCYASSKIIESDIGTNYVSAQKQMMMKFLVHKIGVRGKVR